MGGTNVNTKIRSEWDRLRAVAIHRPGIEMFFGLLEPYGSLYERAFSQDGAIREHERLEHILEHEFHLKVYRLEDTIVEAADTDPALRSLLIKKANDTLHVTGQKNDVTKAMKEIQHNFDLLDSNHFLEILLLSPQVQLESDKGKGLIHLNVSE